MRLPPLRSPFLFFSTFLSHSFILFPHWTSRTLLCHPSVVTPNGVELHHHSPRPALPITSPTIRLFTHFVTLPVSPTSYPCCLNYLNPHTDREEECMPHYTLRVRRSGFPSL